MKSNIFKSIWYTKKCKGLWAWQHKFHFSSWYKKFEKYRNNEDGKRIFIVLMEQRHSQDGIWDVVVFLWLLLPRGIHLKCILWCHKVLLLSIWLWFHSPNSSYSSHNPNNIIASCLLLSDAYLTTSLLHWMDLGVPEYM